MTTSITYLAHNGGCSAAHALSQNTKVFPHTQNLTGHSNLSRQTTKAREKEICEALKDTKVLVVSLSSDDCKHSRDLEIYALVEAARRQIPCALIVHNKHHVELVRSLPGDVRPYIHLGITPSAPLRKQLEEFLPSKPLATVHVAEGLQSEHFGEAARAVETLMA